MTKFAFVQVFSVVALVLVGCGGGEGEGETTTTKKPPVKTPVEEGPSVDTSPTDPPVTGCVAEGEKGNNLGVGAFCSKTQACGKGFICTAPYAPVGAQFCTLLCDTDADCGEGANCFKEARGKGCVPNKCNAK